jgi:flagellar protein FlbD
MIELTRLNGVKFAVNSDHIEIIEETPDTVITLMNGHKYVVKERVREIISQVQAFRRSYSLPEVR